MSDEITNQPPAINRRTVLKAGLALAALADKPALAQSSTLHLGMLHLEPTLGDLDGNCRRIEIGIQKAAAAGAQWVMTSELSLTGYRFDLLIGTDWIKPGPDAYTERLRASAAQSRVNLILGHLEMDGQTGKRYNTAFVIGDNGDILGRHRKINTIPVSEEWSTKGPEPEPITIGGLKIGVLVCADAWPEAHARTLAAQGAQLLLSPATWPPEPHGPEKCWEQRTLDTGLPLFVCNRTGIERDFDTRKAESVAVVRGKRVVRHASEHSTLLRIDWDLHAQKLLHQSAQKL